MGISKFTKVGDCMDGLSSSAVRNNNDFVGFNHLPSTDFPGFQPNYQRRNTLCNEFIRYLSSANDIDVLLIEGRPGIGSTSICAEYFETVQEPAILLVVHAGSRAGYSIPYLLDQGLRQAKIILGEADDVGISENPVADWQRVMLRLRRNISSQRRRLHIIIDGLHQIPVEDERNLQDIVKNVLCLGIPEIRHVITWTEGVKPPAFLARSKVRPVGVPPLNEAEATAYLIASGVEGLLIDEIISSTGCIPAKLSSVVRLSRMGASKLIDLHAPLSGFYELEWNSLLAKQTLTEKQVCNAFAFLAFTKRPLTLAELARYTSIDECLLINLMCDNGFVSVDDRSSLKFSSNTHRDFFCKKLEGQRSDVLNSFVDSLVELKDSPDFIQLLPAYYEELGRHSEIIGALSPQNLDNYLACTKSLSALRRRNELGIWAAKECNQVLEVFRFLLQNSIVRSLELLGSNEARLAAFASIDYFDQALDMAQCEPTKEGQLLLLAQYAKALFNRGLQVDDLIRESISKLLEEVDLSGNKSHSIVVAEYLVGPFPDLAIYVIEQSSQGMKEYQDAAFVHLALKSSSKSNGNREAQTEMYASRISDSNLQGFIRATEGFFSSRTAQEVKDSTRTLVGGQRSFFIRHWIRVNPKNDSALEMADYALDEVARDPSYRPTAADLRIICLPLSCSSNKDRAKEILSRVEVQIASLLDVAPTVDRLRLDIEIARAKIYLELETVDNALSDIYLKISYLVDDGIKLECLCWLYSNLESFDKYDAKAVLELVSLLDEEIRKSIDRCLATTAEHLDVFKGAVSALVESNSDLALEVVSRLNTEERRDQAYRLFAESLIGRRNKKPIPLNSILKSLNSIADLRMRWPAIVSCLDLLVKKRPALSDSPVGLFALGGAIVDPIGRAHALSWIPVLAKHYGVDVDLREKIKLFDQSVSEIDNSAVASELTYWFVERLARVDKSLAKELLPIYQRQLNSRRNFSPEMADVILKLSHLTAIAYSGTLRHKLDIPGHIESIFEIVESIPSVVSQVRVLADIAMRANSVRRADVVQKICEQKLVPLISAADKGNAYFRESLIESAFTPLHLWNQSLATNYLNSLSCKYQDRCRSSLIYYYITDNSTFEPYDDRELKSVRITIGTAQKIVELIEAMSVDNLMVGSIEDFVLGVTSKKSVSEISASQRSELGARLLKKIERDLPDRNNITHHGWLIVAQAYCFKLMGENAWGRWETLVNAAKAIGNTSDSVLILSLIAPFIPAKFMLERKAVMAEAESRLKNIPSRLDSVRRAISISNASFTSEMEEAIAKRLLTNAMKDSLLLSDGDTALEVQKSIIDQAYKVDKDFAEELVALIDDDPARLKAKSVVKASLKSKKIKDAAANKNLSGIGDDPEDVSAVGWDMIGGLNSSRIPARRLEEAILLLHKTSRFTLEESLGSYWWFLKNAQSKYEHNASQSRSYLVPMFELTRLATFLIQKISVRVSGIVDSTGSSFAANKNGNFMLVPGGEGDAMLYIKNWIDEVANEGDEIIICDPYFKVENIDFVKDLSFHKDGLSFVILNCTSDGSGGDLESKYEQAWAKVAHVQPPPLMAVHVNYEGNKTISPIHDRWLLCRDSALRMGTSVNGMFGHKLSEISMVNNEDVGPIKIALNKFIEMRERTLEGNRLKYQVVRW